jgi:WD40 repeat protein/serine/threonine protein kinase/DNA-binding SARP family transcriptional activator
MLEVTMLGQFEIRLEGEPVEIRSRPAQSLLAYLLLNRGTPHRREKLAGLIWPDASETSARNNLRYALWRLRKSIETRQPEAPDYLIADDISIAFDADTEYWLDVSLLESKAGAAAAAEDLIGMVTVYRGELLPGFYDEWVVLERERLQAIFERKMNLLLDRLVDGQRWSEVLEWGERWIALGHTPEPAYCALMIAHGGLGNMSRVAVVYQRCVESLRSELGVGPSEQTRALYEKLIKGGTARGAPIEVAGEPINLAGQMFGAYRVVQKLGEGGMAEVYKAYQLRLDRYVALKFIRPALATAEGFLARFEQEAKVLARLNHPNVVHVYDFGEEGRRCYLAMEYVAGSTLKDWQAENYAGRPMRLDDALPILRQVCAALDYAHAHGVVHRDVKPANILLTPDGRALLSDFGIAKLVGKAWSTPQLGHTPGTPAYLSPEQIGDDSSKIGPASDVYSLAVVLYEMVTGRVPFTAESDMAVMLKHLQDPTPPPRLHNPALSEALEQVILKAMAKDPAGRYPHAGDLLDALERAMADVSQATPPAVSAPPMPSWAPKLPEVEAAPAPGAPPFKGLHYFDEADAGLFFGRERLTAKLVGHLGTHRFLAIVGASGSGKSSIVRAGLIPALRRDQPTPDGMHPPEGSAVWRIHILTPTAHPLEALAASLTRDADSVRATAVLIDDLAGDPRALHLYGQRLLAGPADQQQGQRGEAGLLLVVDQFEELFTLCRSEVERKAFVDNLMNAVAVETDGPARVVVTLRADFYAHCAPHDSLRAAMARRQEYIGPMTAGELRRAIEEPAQRAGWNFEPGLVDLLLQDVGQEPGALPLLSHALLETWQRRRGRTLTFGGYTASGGVRGAIARTAEAVFQNLSSEAQTIARDIFLRLTALGESTGDSGLASPDTRRRVALTELRPPGTPAPGPEVVLQTLAGARLITISEDAAEVAHEALIREWPTLREWLNEGREGLRLHRHLTEAAQAWDRLKRDPGELYRGARLAQAVEWERDASHAGELNALERDFLESSRALAAEAEADREAQQRRELETAQKLARAEKQRAEQQTLAARKLKQRAWFLAGALVIAAALLGLAVVFGRQADANARRAERETRLALARELTMAATNNLNKDPELSTLLALQAVTETYAIDQTVLPEAEDVLHRAVQTTHLLQTLSTTSGSVRGVLFGPKGMRYATGEADGTVKLWDTATGKLLVTLVGHTGFVLNVAPNPDGTRLATASDDATAKVWDQATGKLLLTLSGHAHGDVGGIFHGLMRVVFSRDGTRLATAGTDGTAKVWDAETGSELFTLTGHTAGLTDVAFSPDGTRLATTAFDGTARVWDAATGKQLLTLKGHGDNRIWGLAYSPDGTRIATASRDRTAKVWDAMTGKELLTLTGHTATVNGVAFSPDGKQLATGSLDSTAKVWDAATGAELFTFAGHKGLVHDVAFSPDGTRLVTISTDQTAKLWAVTTGQELLTFFTGAAHDLAYSPDGTRIATASSDGTAAVWDASTGGALLTLHTAGRSGVLYEIAYSRDGMRLAAAGGDHTATVWDAVSGALLFTLKGHSNSVFGVAFSPDGTRLATASTDGTAKVWDAATGRELLSLPGGGRTELFGRIVFSPDGTRLATTNDGLLAKVWDASSGKLLLSLAGHTDTVIGLAFSPDGGRIATASGDQTARIWDATTGRLLLTLSGHTNYVYGVAFSPLDGGMRLATASADDTAKIWDAATGQLLLTLYSAVEVGGVAFSPDGSRLATTNNDQTLRLYLLRVPDLVALARSRLTRTLTAAECQKYLHVESCP